MNPWLNKVGWPFNAPSITANAPARCGVYGLYVGQQWIYFGESNDIQRRLSEHLADTAHAIHRYSNVHFSFETCSAAEKVNRQNELIAAFRPPCNQMLG